MKKTAKTVMLLLCTAITAMLITGSEYVKTGVLNAIILCGKSIIPSLFPIFCVTLIIINSGAVSLAPGKAAPLFIFFLSQISGYPAGAKILGSAVQCGQLKEDAAKKIMPSMICAGPAFIINIAGAHMFSDPLIGVRLYICQICANLIIFIVLGGLTLNISRFTKNIKVTDVLTGSIKQSADSIINICAYVILFSAFSSVVSDIFGNNFSKYFLYIFEVTGAVYNSNNLYITCALLSWSGICVIFQILSVADNIHITILPLLSCRISSAAISCLLLKISFILFPYTKPVISNLNENPELVLTDNIPFVVVLIFSLFVFLISISKRSTGKFFKDITEQYD